MDRCIAVLEDRGVFAPFFIISQVRKIRLAVSFGTDIVGIIGVVCRLGHAVNLLEPDQEIGQIDPPVAVTVPAELQGTAGG